MRNHHKLDAFLAAEEQKAFRVARVSVGNDDDALDVIQDAMLLIALLTVLPQKQQDIMEIATLPAEDIEIISTMDFDDLEDLDFYDWLDLQEGNAG